ncbi:MAG: BTAD domain-containing putative transcriptional regulator [Actinomycetes bacterium]
MAGGIELTRRRTVTFGVLGPLQVLDGNGAQRPVPSSQERTLLACLIARAGSAVSTDALIESIWGERPPRTAGKSLQNHVVRLRRILEPDHGGSPVVLVTDESGYRLAVPDESIDARVFESLARLGSRAYREGRVSAAAQTLHEALALWRGHAFEGMETIGFAERESHRLEEMRLLTLEDRIAADIDLGHARDVVAELEMLLTDEPLRERLWQLLMLALYRSGRQGDALVAYGRARALISDELGVEPGPQLQQIQAMVLEQSSALDETQAHGLPEALLPRPGTFVGRASELGQLRGAWARVVTTGTSRTVLVRGPVGAGVLRVVAELAGELSDEDVAVEYLTGEPPTALATQPTLTVLDARSNGASASLPAAVPGDGDAGPRLLLMLGRPSLSVPADGVVDLEVLGADDVAAILGDYLDRATVDAVLTDVIRLSGGRPGRVHDQGLALARDRAATHVSEAAERAEQVERELGEVRTELRRGVSEYREMIDLSSGPDPGTCPWKGLVPYETGDAARYCGRERLVAELLTRVSSSRLVALVGSSGSGKSSLLQAGLLASLAAGALPGSESWTTWLMRPGRHPMRELVRVAARGTDVPPDRAAGMLQRAASGDDVAPRTLLAVDQLEEAWTACHNEAERAEFLDALAELASDDSQCTVVIAIRADHVGRLADQGDLSEQLGDATLLVGVPSPSELRRAIEVPAGRTGLVLDIGLVDALVEEAVDQPGSLPLLSTSMTELWAARHGRRLTLAAYTSSGGLRGAIARIAEGAYRQLDDDDRAAAKLLLLRLAGSGQGGSVTRLRVPLDELAGLPNARVLAVVEPLTEQRLLSVDAGSVEVAHEALFREWPRLRSWLDEESSDRRLRRRLSQAAADWEERGQQVSDVWRGSRLAAGQGLIEKSPESLTESEQAFIRSGLHQLAVEQRQAEERAKVAVAQTRRLRWLLGAAALALGLASVAGVAAVRAEGTAEGEARISAARELAAASNATMSSDPELSILLARESVETTRSVDGTVLPQSVEALHLAIASSRVVQEFDGVGGFVTWSPDGETFVTEGPEGSGMIDIRDATTGESLRSWRGHDVDINEVQFGADGTLATAGDDGSAAAWDVETGEEIGRLEGSGRGKVWSPSLSADGRLLCATFADEHAVRVMNLRSGRVVLDYESGSWAVTAALSPDGSQIAIALYSGKVVVVDVDSGKEIQHFPSGRASALRWSPDGRWLAGTGEDVTRVWNPATGVVRASPPSHKAATLALAWSPDSRSVATASVDGTAVVSTLTPEGVRSLPPLASRSTQEGLVGVAFDPSGTRIMVGNVSVSAAVVFDVAAEATAEWGSIPLVPGTPNSAVFTTDGQQVLTSAPRGSIAVADGDTGRVEQRLVPFPADRLLLEPAPPDIEVSPDGRFVAAAGGRRVRVWELSTGARAFMHRGGPAADFIDVAWSHDGARLAAVASLVEVAPDRFRGSTTILDLDGHVVDRVTELGKERLPVSVAFSPDGTRLATGWDRVDVQLGVWGVTIWEEDTPVVALDDISRAPRLTYFPDGRNLLVANTYGAASVLDAETGERVVALDTHVGGVLDVAVSSDGSTAATAGQDGTVRLWDTATWSQELVLPAHDGSVTSVNFSPDGDRLVSAGEDGLAKIWALGVDDLLSIADGRLTRAFTDEECRQYLHTTQCL